MVKRRPTSARISPSSHLLTLPKNWNIFFLNSYSKCPGTGKPVPGHLLYEYSNHSHTSSDPSHHGGRALRRALTAPMQGSQQLSPCAPPLSCLEARTSSPPREGRTQLNHLCALAGNE